MSLQFRALEEGSSQWWTCKGSPRRSRGMRHDHTSSLRRDGWAVSCAWGCMGCIATWRRLWTVRELVMARESVVIWVAGTAVLVAPSGASAWDPDRGTASGGRDGLVRVEWLQELRTTLDADSAIVCAPLQDPDWLVLPEANLEQVRRVLHEEGYDVVVDDPLPAAPCSGDALLGVEISDFQRKAALQEP